MLCQRFSQPLLSWGPSSQTAVLRMTVALLLCPAAAAMAKDAAAPDRTQSMEVLKVGAEPLRIETGLVRGLIVGEANDIQLYRGIPYAAPPVGDLRWRPPQPAQAWRGVRESYAFGAAAPQKPVALLSMFPGMALGAKTNEDCLYLNVWAPVRSSAEPRPVMVWIHGGGYTFGAASQALYDGANLARRGVVVVAMNYRLGPLGFLAHPQLSAESGRGASGNYGLMDQIEALRWVKRNISAFGGDPDRVTIFGESAGGNSVYSLLLSPLAKGLFQRAISQSGASLNFAHVKQSHYGYRSAEQMGLEFANKCGAPQGPGQLAALRAMSAEDLLKASSGFETPRSLDFQSDRARFGPVVDGWVIPDDAMTLFEKGRVNSVPLIVGANAEEGSLFTLSTTPPEGSEEYRAVLAKSFGAKAAATLSGLYPPSDLRRAVSDLMGDYLFVAPARYVARAIERTKTPVYLYHFAHPTPGPIGKMLGAHHGAEIAYVLDNLQLAPHHSSVDDRIRDALASYWVQFAASGNPNRQGLPDWPAYEPASDRCLLVKETIETTQGLRRSKLDAIDGLMETWRNESGLTERPHPTASPTAPRKSHRPEAAAAGNKTTHLTPKAAVPKPSEVRAPKAAVPQTERRNPRARPSVPVANKTGLAPSVVSQKPPIGASHGALSSRGHRTVIIKMSAVAEKSRPRSGASPVHLPIPPEPAVPPAPAKTAHKEFESELRQARFLAKAGLGPMAIDALGRIIKEAPGTPAALEAQRILNSLPKAK